MICVGVFVAHALMTIIHSQCDNHLHIYVISGKYLMRGSFQRFQNSNKYLYVLNTIIGIFLHLRVDVYEQIILSAHKHPPAISYFSLSVIMAP